MIALSMSLILFSRAVTPHRGQYTGDSNFCIAHSSGLRVLKGHCSVWVENFGERKYLLELWYLLKFLVFSKRPIEFVGPPAPTQANTSAS